MTRTNTIKFVKTLRNTAYLPTYFNRNFFKKIEILISTDVQKCRANKYLYKNSNKLIKFCLNLNIFLFCCI